MSSSTKCTGNDCPICKLFGEPEPMAVIETVDYPQINYRIPQKSLDKLREQAENSAKEIETDSLIGELLRLGKDSDKQ